MSKYCKNCKQEVGLKSHVNWLWLIAWLLLTGPGVLIYIIYVLGFKEKDVCIRCGCIVDDGKVVEFGSQN